MAEAYQALPRSTRRKVRRVCGKLVTMATTGGAPDLGELLGCVETWRHRPVTLAPMNFEGGAVFGMVIGLPAHDVIVFERETTQSHQLYIVFHEVGHLVLGHDLSIKTDDAGRGHSSSGATLFRKLCNDIPSTHEQEAEYFAQVLFEKLQSPLAYSVSEPPTSVASRVIDTLSGGVISHDI